MNFIAVSIGMVGRTYHFRNTQPHLLRHLPFHPRKIPVFGIQLLLVNVSNSVCDLGPHFLHLESERVGLVL